jgi:nucleotide-binding universal stress UspA family protein
MMAAFSDWNKTVQSQEKRAKSVENIVLFLGDAQSSTIAVPVARRLSELYSATLHVTYVGKEIPDLSALGERFGFDTHPVQSIAFEPGEENAGKQVARLAHDLPKTIVVMSTQTGRATDKNRFGLMTESMFSMRPERAVLLSSIRGDNAWDIHRILLAHDGTPACQAATESAAELAQCAGAEVVALHVAARGEEPSEQIGSIPAPQYVDQPQHEWPAWAEEFMSRVLAAGALPSSVRFKLAVAGGQAGSEVAQAAREENADLVVMAWHGHWERKSCATRVVVKTSGCPVMLVYSPDSEISAGDGNEIRP